MEHGQGIIPKTKCDFDEEERKDNGETMIRKRENKLYILERYGILGKYIRIQLPNYILGSICWEWTYTAGTYMGL